MNVHILYIQFQRLLWGWLGLGFLRRKENGICMFFLIWKWHEKLIIFPFLPIWGLFEIFYIAIKICRENFK